MATVGDAALASTVRCPVRETEDSPPPARPTVDTPFLASAGRADGQRANVPASLCVCVRGRSNLLLPDRHTCVQSQAHTPQDFDPTTADRGRSAPRR